MPDLETVLYTRLSGFAGLSALVSSRVYPLEPPQNPTAPYVTYQRVDEQVLMGMTQDHGMTAPMVQVDCWGETYASARSVAAQVRSALKRWSDAATNPVVLDSFLRSSRDMGRDGEVNDAEPRLFRMSLDFEIWHRE
jgi:hypothetical protein